ncbi:DUF302 domain-containing protein [Nocardia sp. NPDC101769]|uniref:DUF302 domain-containing protein n=1 Tax=Nocardia sp. NPDC101769 TaxID=3364333 RepID=UPI0038047256
MAILTKQVPGKVAEVVEHLRSLLEARQVTVFAVIDQAAAAEHAGTGLRDTVLVMFGDPAAGTPVMAAEPLAAVDLPLKVVIWDDEGTTKVSYRDPVEQAVALGVPEQLAARLAAVHVVTDALAVG